MGDCTGTSLQSLRRSARRIHWDLAADATAESETRPIKTVCLCRINGVTYGVSIRLSGSHRQNRVASASIWRSLKPELYEDLNPMMPERASQTARKLVDELRVKGFGVANGMCDGSQSYESSLAHARRRKLQTLSTQPMRSNFNDRHCA
jgi:hypothetical protein